MIFKYEDILNKARRFCAYRERALSEVQHKLGEWKAGSEISARVIQNLREEGYLSDERFAYTFVRGKFRIKQWGKIKIMAALRTKKIADDIIERAIGEISEEEYLASLAGIIEKKRSAFADPASPANLNRLIQHAMSKGYEKHLIYKVLNQLSLL